MSRRSWALAVTACLAACGQTAPVTGTDAAAADATPGDAVDAADDVTADTGPASDDTTSSVGLWTPITLPGESNVSLHGVWSDGSTRVVAVGTNGTVVTWDGLGWSVASAGKFATLNAVTGSASAGMVFAVGMGGTVVQSAGQDGSVGKVWAPPGGCLAPSDCDDADVCTTDVCESGVCQHDISGAPGCCGGVVFADSFDSGLGKWTVTDDYAGSVYDGGIVWKAAGMYGIDGVLRASSPPSAAYFGRTDVPCADDASKSCATFDNGKTVGSVMTSEEFTVPSGETATLTFQLFLDVQSGFYDSLQISVIAADGSSNVIADKQNLWPSGNTNGEFLPQSLDLTAYMGQKIKLSIRFDTYTSSGNDGDGVFIDDLVVSTTCVSGSQAGKGLTSRTLFGAWAFADNDAYAVGDGGVIAHWDGTAWGLQAGANTGELDGMAGASGVGILAVGDLGVVGSVTSTGVAPTPVPTASHLYAVAVDPVSGGGFNACAVGAGGVTLDGNSATGWKLGPSATSDLTGVTANGSGGWIAVSPSGDIFERTKGATSWVDVDAIGGFAIRGVTHTPSGEIIAVGDFGLVSTRTSTSSGWGLSIGDFTQTNLWGVTAVSDAEFWAVGEGGKSGHFVNGAWLQVQTTTTQNLRAVWAASADAVFAVGLAGAIEHWDGKAWKKLSGPLVNGKASTTNWYAVWGNAADDVYTMGDAGQIAHWDGQAWTAVGTQIAGSMRCVWGIAHDDVWAVGELGLIYHNDGTGWTQTPIPDYQPTDTAKPYKITTTLLAVWGAATDDVWAVGEPDSKGNGVLVHWDGSSWGYDPSFASESRTVRALWGWGKDKILIAGTQGMALRFDGQGNYQDLHPGTIATLFGITGYGKDALLVGDIGTVLRWTPLD